LAQPLVPSTAFADAWIQVDRTENPRFFVNLLDATRTRLLERARTSPREFYAPLALRPGLNVLDVGCGTGDFFASWLRSFLRGQPLAWISVRP
jgi:cyclopropane fatty-acyl-phospholipid synthase-like methyltransferase